MIKINGKNIPEALGETLSAYLEKSGYNPERVAVEVNYNIISKSEYKSYIISEDDEIEIVSFMGGG
ncbi:MAG: sulfur carrier protein ThiS [Oscillospiraceae bacterium]|nr:sulfur carrier protein ThiS [Oscillospiraceae bacterium]